MVPKSGLIRLTHTDGGLLVDLTFKKPGRGAYVCQNEECINKAAKNHGIERSLKTAVSKEILEVLKGGLAGTDG